MSELNFNLFYFNVFICTAKGALFMAFAGICKRVDSSAVGKHVECFGFPTIDTVEQEFHSNFIMVG